MQTEKKSYDRRVNIIEEIVVNHPKEITRGVDKVGSAKLRLARVMPRRDWKPRQKKSLEDKDLDRPCPVHTHHHQEGNLIIPKHTARQCRTIRKVAQSLKEELPKSKDKQKKAKVEFE